MPYLRSTHLALFLLLQLCLFLSATNAIPVAIKRQDGQSTTVMTQYTTSTPIGDMTQTCIITLTPITVNGQQEVQEVKTCTLSTNASNNSNGGDASSSSNTTGNSSGSTSPDNSGATSTDSSNSGATSTDSSGAVSTESVGSPVSVNGVSEVQPASVTASGSASASPTDSGSVSASAIITGSTSASATGVPLSTGAGVSAGSVPAPSGNSATSSSTQQTAAADQASPSSSAAFTVPGQKIQVLPIGLGVFAGISVIALIVVGLVTYERTKYRKAFRARKLAESGQGMGYGGMAQR